MYSKSKKYVYFLMENINNGKIRVTSFHNSAGKPNLRSKNWKIISEPLDYTTANSRLEYLRKKKSLK